MGDTPMPPAKALPLCTPASRLRLTPAYSSASTCTVTCAFTLRVRFTATS